MAERARKGRWRPHPRQAGSFVDNAEYARLGRHLRDARLAADLSQRELAHLVKRVPSYIAKIETGQRRVYMEEFLDIARAMRLDAGQFLADFIKRASTN
jgi:transcriptional regulator with XRE-family HTH domain